MSSLSVSKSHPGSLNVQKSRDPTFLLVHPDSDPSSIDVRFTPTHVDSEGQEQEVVIPDTPTLNGQTWKKSENDRIAETCTADELWFINTFTNCCKTLSAAFKTEYITCKKRWQESHANNDECNTKLYGQGMQALRTARQRLPIWVGENIDRVVLMAKTASAIRLGAVSSIIQTSPLFDQTQKAVLSQTWDTAYRNLSQYNISIQQLELYNLLLKDKQWAQPPSEMKDSNNKFKRACEQKHRSLRDVFDTTSYDG